MKYLLIIFGLILSACSAAESELTTKEQEVKNFIYETSNQPEVKERSCRELMALNEVTDYYNDSSIRDESALKLLKARLYSDCLNNDIKSFQSLVKKNLELKVDKIVEDAASDYLAEINLKKARQKQIDSMSQLTDSELEDELARRAKANRKTNY